MIETENIVLFISYIILLSFRIYNKTYENIESNYSIDWLNKLEKLKASALIIDFLSLFIINKFLLYLFNPWLAAINLFLLLPFLISFKYQKLSFLVFIFYFHDFYLFFNQNEILKADLGLILSSLIALFMMNQLLSRKVLILSIMLIATKSNIPYSEFFLSIASIVLFIDGIKLLQKNFKKEHRIKIYTILSDLYILSFIIYSQSFTKNAIIFFTIVLVIRYFYDSFSKKMDLYFLILSRFSVSLLVFESNQNQIAIFVFYLVLWFMEIKSYLFKKNDVFNQLLEKIIFFDNKKTDVVQLPKGNVKSDYLNILKHHMHKFNAKDEQVEYLSSGSVDESLVDLCRKAPEYVFLNDDINEYYQVKIWLQDFYQLEKQLSKTEFLLKKKDLRTELTFILIKQNLKEAVLKIMDENIHEYFPYAQVIFADKLRAKFHFNEHVVVIKEAILFKSRDLTKCFQVDQNQANKDLIILPNYSAESSVEELLQTKTSLAKFSFYQSIVLQKNPFQIDRSKYNFYQRYSINSDPCQDPRAIDAKYSIFLGDLLAIEEVIFNKTGYAYDLILSTEESDFTETKCDYGICSIEYFNNEKHDLITFLDDYFQRDNDKKTSIIIPYYNNGFYTYQCIKSIQANTHLNYEILIIDNASTDKWANKIKAIKGIKYIRNRSNLGFAGAVNTGLRQAIGDYLLILNNDVIVSQFWLERMLLPIERGELDLVGPISNEISGPQKINLNYNGLDEYHIKSKHYTNKYKSKLIRTDRVVGFCMLFKRELFNDIGYFDERYEIGNFEDDDYCLRLKLKNYRMGFTHGCYIHHYGSLSFKNNQFTYNDILNVNRERFLTKWKHYLLNAEYSIYQLIKDYTILESKEIFRVNSNRAFDRLYHDLKRKGRLIHYIELSNMLIQKKYNNEALKLLDDAINENSASLLLKMYRLNLSYDMGSFTDGDLQQFNEIKVKLKNHANTYYIDCFELLKNGKTKELSDLIDIIEFRDPFSDLPQVFRNQLIQLSDKMQNTDRYKAG